MVNENISSDVELPQDHVKPPNLIMETSFRPQTSQTPKRLVLVKENETTPFELSTSTPMNPKFPLKGARRRKSANSIKLYQNASFIAQKPYQSPTTKISNLKGSLDLKGLTFSERKSDAFAYSPRKESLSPIPARRLSLQDPRFLPLSRLSPLPGNTTTSLQLVPRDKYTQKFKRVLKRRKEKFLEESTDMSTQVDKKFINVQRLNATSILNSPEQDFGFMFQKLTEAFPGRRNSNFEGALYEGSVSVSSLNNVDDVNYKGRRRLSKERVSIRLPPSPMNSLNLSISRSPRMHKSPLSTLSMYSQSSVTTTANNILHDSPQRVNVNGPLGAHTPQSIQHSPNSTQVQSSPIHLIDIEDGKNSPSNNGTLAIEGLNEKVSKSHSVENYNPHTSLQELELSTSTNDYNTYNISTFEKGSLPRSKRKSRNSKTPKQLHKVSSILDFQPESLPNSRPSSGYLTPRLHSVRRYRNASVSSSPQTPSSLHRVRPSITALLNESASPYPINKRTFPLNIDNEEGSGHSSVVIESPKLSRVMNHNPREISDRILKSQLTGTQAEIELYPSKIERKKKTIERIYKHVERQLVVPSKRNNLSLELT